MPKKNFSKKLVLNKTTVTRLDQPQMGEVNGGVRTIANCTMDLYLCPTAWSIAGDHGCIYTDSHMATCPTTATLCGQWQCP